MAIAKLIEKSGKSNAQIAAAAGVSVVTVWRYRKGVRLVVQEGEIAGMARALGVTPSEIRPDLAELFAPKRKGRAA